MPKQSHAFEFKSDLKELDRLPEVLASICKRFQLRDEIVNMMMLPVSEGITNAMKHGNRLDPAKPVSVTFSQPAVNQLKVEIKDKGEGFDPEKLPDPLAEENLLKPGGRGVYLMKQSAHEVTYNEKGNKLTLQFDTTDIQTEL